jgi:hypothetical protein
MKWRNKCSEFDQEFSIYEKYIKNNNGRIKIYIYGNIRKDYISTLELFKEYLDIESREKAKLEEEPDGFAIYDIGVDMLQIRKPLVNNRDDVFQDKETMDKWIEYKNHFFLGFPSEKDFFNTLFPILFTYVYNKTFLPSTQVFITPRCTLKCIGCCNGCNKWNNLDKSKDMDFDTFKTSIDYLFKHFDYVGKIALVGGETFLHSQLGVFVEYIYQNYYNRLGSIYIYTNNTVLLKESLLPQLQDPKTVLFVSFYDVPLFNKIKNTNLNFIYKNKLNVFLCADITRRWIDWKLGTKRELSLDQENTIYNCRERDIPGIRCTAVYKNKFFACCVAGAYYQMENIELQNYDYLDLSRDDIPKKEILEFTKYYSDTGYTTMCKYCQGENSELMSVAIQENSRRKRRL